MRKKICSIIALVATLLITNIIQCAEKKISSHYRLKLHRISLTPPADSDLLNIIKSYVINPSSIKVNHLEHYYISENRVRASYETSTISLTYDAHENIVKHLNQKKTIYLEAHNEPPTYWTWFKITPELRRIK